MLGRNLSLLQGPLTDPTVFEHSAAALAAGQPTQGEAILYRKDGSDYLAEWYLTPVHNEEGATTHWMVLLRDITARRAMEDRVRAAERLGALGSVAAGVAHEFNNVLAGIMGRLDLLERRDPRARAASDPAGHPATPWMTGPRSSTGSRSSRGSAKPGH